VTGGQALLDTLFQSAPLHEGRRRSFRRASTITSFNPRPCTRGDRAGRRRRDTDDVSIRAPARGATPTSARPRPSRCFNPRPCTRGDSTSSGAAVPSAVSIRAPARGATQGILAHTDVLAFQSAPLHEGRPHRQRRRDRRGCFNPRPCTRGDVPYPIVIPGAKVSIRAPARGATSIVLLLSGVLGVSIRAPARGATVSRNRGV